MVKRETPWAEQKRLKDQQTSRKRDAVIDAAAHLFQTRGYEYSTLSDLADELEVAKPTVYRYFVSKVDILMEILRRTQESIVKLLKQAETSPGTGIERLHLALIDFGEVMTTDAGKCLALLSVNSLGDKDRVEVYGRIAVAEASILGMIDAGIEDGTLQVADPKLAYLTLFGALNWLSRWFDADGAMSSREVVATQVALLLRGAVGPRAPERFKRGDVDLATGDRNRGKPRAKIRAPKSPAAPTRRGGGPR